MKVGIVGNYGNNNNGDEAILLGIITQLTGHFAIVPEDITVFSNNPEQTTERYGVQSYPLYYKSGSPIKTFKETVSRNYPVVKGLDVVIVGGGGILMDLYKREAPLYGTYGLMGKRAGAKVVVYGCGAGPLTSAIGKFFIRRLAKAADSISVRDPKSKALLQSVGVKKEIMEIGDPAFTLRAASRAPFSERIKKVGVTAVPYFNIKYWPVSDEAKYNAYVDGMAANLDRLIDEKDVDVTFFSTKYPQDVWVTEDIYKRMKRQDRALVNGEHLSPAELVAFCAEQDLVIGTRLHSIILSLDAKTPVIGVSYHHKVEHFFQMTDQMEQCLSMDDISASDGGFADKAELLEQDWQGTQDRISRLSDELKAKAEIGLKQLSMLPKKGQTDE